VIDFFALLLVLFLLAVFLRLDWIYYLIYVIGGIWAFSHWQTRRSLGHLRVQRRMPNRAFSGETIDAEVVIQNTSLLPMPWVRIQESVPLELQTGESYRLVASLGGRTKTVRSFRFFCHRRGYYQVGPLRLTTGDLFGFAQSSWEESENPHITVYPKVLTLDQLGLPSRLPFGTVRSRQRLFMDPTRMAGVRPYVSGDSMRHIHWRASAHDETLLVKKFQPSIALTTMIVLDLDQLSYPHRERLGGSEWAVVIAASLANHIISQRQETGLLTNGLDPFGSGDANPIPGQNGQGHLMGILEVLARIQLRRDADADDPMEDGQLSASRFALHRWLPSHVASLGWGTTLVLVTPHISEPLLWSLHSFNRKGINVQAVVSVRQPGFDRMRQQAEAMGISVHQALWESELAQIGQRGGFNGV
jgi:uncharacterized protein (DUF58 family)